MDQNTTAILDTIKSDQLQAAGAAQNMRCRLATQVRRGLRAEARLVAAQIVAYGPEHAAELAAHRGRDRKAVIAAVLAGVQS